MECNKCGHKWKVRKTTNDPLCCPKCKRYDYNMPSNPKHRGVENDRTELRQ